MTDSHYDAKADQFGDRERRKASPLEITLAKLETEFVEFRKAIEEDLADNKLTLQNTIEFNSSMLSQTHEALRQMQENIRTQLQQNDAQHREIVSILKEDMATLVKSAEQRIELMNKLQKMTDADQEKRLGCVETDVSLIKTEIAKLKIAPTAAKAKRWEKVALAVGALGISVLTAWATSTIDKISEPASQAIQAVLPGGTPHNEKAVPRTESPE